MISSILLFLVGSWIFGLTFSEIKKLKTEQEFILNQYEGALKEKRFEFFAPRAGSFENELSKIEENRLLNKRAAKLKSEITSFLDLPETKEEIERIRNLKKEEEAKLEQERKIQKAKEEAERKKKEEAEKKEEEQRMYRVSPEMALEAKVYNGFWYLGGFDTVPIIKSLKIVNKANFAIKDFTIEMEFTTASGTSISKCKQTVYSIIPAKGSYTVRDLNMGCFVNSQVKSATLRITKASITL